MKKNKWLSLLLAVCSVGCIGLATGTLSATAEENSLDENKTLTLQSGYRSGMFAPISKIRDKKGATVEFDLYESNLKELNYNKSFDVMSSSGTSGSLACVSFVFGKPESYPDATDNVQCPAWHTYNSLEINFGGFQYFCNGQIKEWSYQGSFKLINEYIGDPSAFMEEGYSYKVGIRYDTFEYNGEEYGGTGNTWYYVERKGIFDEESEYEILFAFKKQVAEGSTFTNETMAGMEVQGLCKNANVGGSATSADGKGYSVNMEIDNLRIYDGTVYENAKKKYAEDFENVAEEQLKLSDMSDNEPTLNVFGDKNYLALPSGIRSIFVNYGAAIGKTEATTCRLGMKDRSLFTVVFKDKTTKTIVGTQKAYTDLDFSSKKIYSGEKVYKFDYSGIDFSQITGSVEVYGTPVSYFTLKLIAGVNGVNDKTQRVTVEGKFKLESDVLVREDYELVGFTSEKGGAEAEYKLGDVVDMRCQDLTLYAIWKLKNFKTVFTSGKKTLDTVTTRPGVTPFYQGPTPERAGYAFAGWSTVVLPSQDQTLTAKFVEIGDENTENKALSVNGRLSFKREGYNSFKSVEVIFDLITLPENASIRVLDTDVTEFLTEGYRVKAAVSTDGKITVSQAYMDSEKYTVLGTTQTALNTNAYMTVEFEGNIVLDTLTMTYNDANAYVESFEGIERVSEGIYNNYYTVEGEAEIVSLAKDKVVTFVDETTGREVFKEYTYAGGNVALVEKIAGVSHEIVWDKEQAELLNVQNDVTVKASLTWQQCTVSFVVNGVFDLIPTETVIDPVKGIYGQKIELPTVVVGNYAIIGWTDEPNGGYAKYTGDYVLTKEDLKLYAVWGGKPITVEFYAEDGTTLLEKQTVEYKATVLFGGELPVKEGYKFVGWDKSTVGVEADLKFVAVYEKLTRTDVVVSVLGGNGAGRYAEGDVVTISFQEIDGFVFAGWNVISGGVTIEEKDGKYTFVVGVEDVVIEAVVESVGGGNGGIGCTASLGAGAAGIVTLCGAAVVVCKRKKRD